MHQLVRKVILNIVSSLFPPKSTGRPRLPANEILNVIDIVLASGMAWRHISKLRHGLDFRSVHNTFRAWIRSGVFEQAYTSLLRIHRHTKRAKHYCMDSTMIKNVFGTNCIGRNPTDRGRMGTKMVAMVDHEGIPISLLFTPANTSDMRVVEHLFKNRFEAFIPNVPLFSDRGFRSKRIRKFVANHTLKPTFPKKRRRWFTSPHAVVEHFFAWIDKSRRLIVRYETKISSYRAFVLLASSHILVRRIHNKKFIEPSSQSIQI